MKKYVIVALGLFTSFIKTHGQSTTTLTPISQLYVVVAEGKKLITYNEIEAKKNESEATQKTIDFIKQEWIESIHVLKGKEATDLYGKQGENGVVLIHLKKDALSEMSSENRNKFKE